MKIISWIKKTLLNLVPLFKSKTKRMAQFSEGQEVLYQNNKYTVTKVTPPATETTYELTPVPEPPVVLENIAESEISGE